MSIFKIWQDELNLIIQFFGEKSQYEKLSEEQDELFEAINEGDKLHIAEEIADNLVMIEQVRIMNGIDREEIYKIISDKINRTLSRIDNGQY